MDRNPNASSSSMRDLTRTQPPLPPPPFSSSLPPPPPPPPPPDPSFSHPQPSHGLVVVGFIARRRSDVSQLINRIIDSDVFGSSNRSGSLRIAGEEVEDWLKNRKIEYYLDEESRILYVQLCSMKCPAMVSDLEELKLGFDSVLEEHEFRDLQGMLFMFTVCHVIVYIQEGSSFNTQVLRKFRVLQHAKHALTPILRSQGTLPSFSRPPSSTLRSPTSATSSKSPSPRRGSGMSNRSSSGVSVLSGLGLHTMLFPGQCTPVTLFAFLDDFSDMTNGTATAEESSDSSSSQSTDVSILGRPGLPVKGSGPVVMLARPANKCEGGLRKKLQSSLEAQIRFLIKKCRTLTGLESNHSGSRSAALSGSSPLLTLDASRAVVLLDSSVIQKGKSLCFATDLVEEVLNGKATPDSLLLESHSQTGNNEDLATLKEFIFRQADILRGKGGPVANANSGSAAGVGMVAVAAAAAAASAASGKTTSAPELPNLGTWLSSSQLILKEIFCVKNGYLREADVNGGEAWQRNGTIPQGEGIAFKGADSLCAATFLQSGKGINRKFSTLWCQRVLPAAMQVYLKDLPACYPTSLHEAHLEKALRAFYSMVKGPLVQDFAKRLEDECTSIWKSGRQLCDAISLTGKPCMHQRHDAPSDGMSADAVGKGHRSGFVFLHACACGRSRRLRPDPFDFEAANFTFNNFPDCDMLLPALQLPKLYTAESIQPSSWIVVRVGGAGYYEPSKGLLQSGLLTNQKFLLKWTITLDKDEKNVSFANAVRQGTMIVSATGPENESNMDFKKGDIALVKPGETQTSTGGRGKSVDKPKAEDKMISFGRGLPNITMKKAFSEVVAGSASADSAFPPLQPKKPLLHGPGKGGKKTAARDGSREHIDTGCDSLMSVRAEEMPSGSESATGMHAFTDTDAKPFLQIGSNVVPLNVDDRGNANEKSLDDGGRMKFSPSSENFVVYVGFEHECPHGHRFILSPELLNKLDSPYSLLEESPIVSVENVENKHSDHLKLGKVDGNIMSNRQAKGTNVALKSMRSLEKAGGRRTNGSIFEKGLSHSSKKAELYQESVSSSADPGQSKKFVNLDDNGQAVSILNRNLPIYMSCPYCRVSKNKEDQQSEMFAGTLSQLQRIFVVTPPFPLVLATNPVIQFEASCQPSNVSSLKQQLQFSLGCQVILPPESFVSIRLPFIYGAKFEDSGLIPLKPLDDRPQLTAWIVGGTALQVKRSRD